MERIKVTAAAARASNQTYTQNATRKRKAARSIKVALIKKKAAQTTKRTPALITNTKI